MESEDVNARLRKTALEPCVGDDPGGSPKARNKPGVERKRSKEPKRREHPEAEMKWNQEPKVAQWTQHKSRLIEQKGGNRKHLREQRGVNGQEYRFEGDDGHNKDAPSKVGVAGL